MQRARAVSGKSDTEKDKSDSDESDTRPLFDRVVGVEQAAEVHARLRKLAMRACRAPTAEAFVVVERGRHQHGVRPL